MRYIIYVRKSTEDEDRQVLLIEAHLTELREFAAKEKLEIIIGAAEPRFAGLASRRRRRRKRAELFSKYSKVLKEALAKFSNDVLERYFALFFI